MINKKNIWFLTLFSLILVLSIYYVTMPNDLLISSNLVDNEIKEDSAVISEPKVEITETSILTSLRVEDEESYIEELDNIKLILNDNTKTIEEKNDAYERLKNINNTKSEQEKLEKQVKTKFDLESFIKIEGNQIRVVVDSSNHDVSLANKIMRCIQDNYENDMHISVKFQSK